MSYSEQLEKNLTKLLDRLPEEKAIELIDFANFLANKYSHDRKTQIDSSSLLMQQKNLSKIWDNPEEDVYEL